MDEKRHDKLPSNLPAPGRASEALLAALAPPRGKPAGGASAAIRGGRVAAVAPPAGSAQAALLGTAVSGASRPRLVFAVDATASREPAWEAARSVTDSLFTAVPGEIDVALAVHSGGKAWTHLEFHSDAAHLRDTAAAVRCHAGQTRMLSVLDLVRRYPGVRAVVYIGDCFEEDPDEALAMADALKARGTKLVILHDLSSGAKAAQASDIFLAMARRTGGAVLPFDGAAPGHLREVFAAVSIFAARGRQALCDAAAARALPGARLLLQHLPGGK
jgi:hypothetical protein